VSAAETLLEEPGAAVDSVCRSCGSSATSVFYEQADVPVHSCQLVPTREAALAFPRGRLRLVFCGDCGFIANTAFEGSHQDYSVAYEETQGFSPRFRAFARDLAAGWVERYDLRGKRIIEIGCGKGEFLATICELGDNDGLGIDPAFVEERLPAHGAGRLTFVSELYDGDWGPLEADAVVCRHTVEHIAPVREFLANIRRGIGDRTDTVVLFDLPDVVRVLREAAFWDLYYEHCSYFSPGSMARLFRRCGFDVLDVSLDYDDQYIVLEARPAMGAAAPATPSPSRRPSRPSARRWTPSGPRSPRPAVAGATSSAPCAPRAVGRWSGARARRPSPSSPPSPSAPRWRSRSTSTRSSRTCSSPGRDTGWSHRRRSSRSAPTSLSR
jgi:hypothetical protein